MAPLCELFQSLYNNTVQQDSVISALGTWVINNWVWNFEWRADLTETEAETAHDLLLILEQ
ncbi:hypothetical protein A2U01_0036532, partial [Trifolium medium]|nr:hypothetical protein [Trifolium medium]